MIVYSCLDTIHAVFQRIIKEVGASSHNLTNGRLRTRRFGVSVEAGESSGAREPIGRVGPSEL